MPNQPDQSREGEILTVPYVPHGDRGNPTISSARCPSTGHLTLDRCMVWAGEGPCPLWRASREPTLRSSEEPGAVGGWFYSNDRVRWPLVPMEDVIGLFV